MPNFVAKWDGRANFLDMKLSISFVYVISLLLFASALQAGLSDLLPAELVDASGEPVARETLEGKIVGIYFSAEWCPPCRGFTPSLVEFRNANTDQFEVVFVSSDRTPEAQMKYMQGYKMDFPAVSHGSNASRELAERFSVRGIPFLVIVDSDGNTITTNGRGDISSDPQGALARWKTTAG